MLLAFQTDSDTTFDSLLLQQQSLKYSINNIEFLIFLLACSPQRRSKVEHISQDDNTSITNWTAALDGSL